MKRLRTTAAAARALAGRGRGKATFSQTSINTWTWDVAGQCRNPSSIFVRGRPTQTVGRRKRHHPIHGEVGVLGERESESGLPVHGELTVRCRKCDPCLRFRRAQWTSRALAELQDQRLHGRRTWFGTLTLAPDRHVEFEAQAARRCRNSSVDWYSRHPDDKFRRYVREVYHEVQLFFKRLRKNSGCRFRYIIVAEKHTQQLSGYAHFHLLLFEQEGSVRKGSGNKSPVAGTLEVEWKLGHSHWRLVRDDEPERKVAGYVAKYLSKDLASRVWGSQDLSRAKVDTAEHGGYFGAPVSLEDTFLSAERKAGKP